MPMNLYCPQCGTRYELHESRRAQATCPECGDQTIQNMTHDMAHGGNWSGMTETQGLSDLPQQESYTNQEGE